MSSSSKYELVCEKRSEIISWLKSHPGSTAVDIDFGVFDGDDDIGMQLAITRCLNVLSNEKKVTSKIHAGRTTIWYLPGDEKKWVETKRTSKVNKEVQLSTELKRLVKCAQCVREVEIVNSFTSKHCSSDNSFCSWKCVGLHQQVEVEKVTTNEKKTRRLRCIQCGLLHHVNHSEIVRRFGVGFRLCSKLCHSAFKNTIGGDDLDTPPSKRTPEETEEKVISSTELKRLVKCAQCVREVEIVNSFTSKHCQADFSFCSWKCVGVHQRNSKVDETVKCIQCGTEDNRCKFSKVYRFGTSFMLCTAECITSFDAFTRDSVSSKRKPEDEEEKEEPPTKKAKKRAFDDNIPIMIEIEVERDECLGRYFYRYAVPSKFVSYATTAHLRDLSEYGCTSKKGLEQSRELIKNLCETTWKEYLLKTTFDHTLSFSGFYHIQDDFFRVLYDDEIEESDSEKIDCDEADIVCTRCKLIREECECKRCDECSNLIDYCECPGNIVTLCSKCDKPEAKDEAAKLDDDADFCHC